MTFFDEQLIILAKKLREGDLSPSNTFLEAPTNKMSSHDIRSEQMARQTKKASLSVLQSAYFDLLDEYIGKPYRAIAKRHHRQHVESQDEIVIKETVAVFLRRESDFVDAITRFWKEYAPSVYEYLCSSNPLKGVFGGAVVNCSEQNIALSAGLYLDTIVMPDPLIQGKQFLTTLQSDVAATLTIKRALDALSYKDLALAEVDTPIVVFAPYLSHLNSGVFELIGDQAMLDLLKHFSMMFDRPFGNLYEVMEFIDRAPNNRVLAEKVVDKGRALFETTWQEPLEYQINKNQETMSQNAPFDIKNRRSLFFLAFWGRILQANNLLFQSIRVGGSPFVNALTAWQYLLWKYEYDASPTTSISISNQDVSIVSALTVDGNPALSLLSNLSVEALIELRRRGVLLQMREVISAGIEDIEMANSNCLQQRFDQVYENINNALKQQAFRLEELSKKQKRYFGLDVSKMMAIAGLAIAAPITRNIYLGASAGLAALFSRNPIDVVTEGKDILSERRELKRSPVGILYKRMNS